MTSPWRGRVFVHGTVGGNAAVVVTEQDLDPRTRATTFGVRSAVFVTRRTGHRVQLRTFTPTEELGICLTAALAAPVALGARPGQAWTTLHTSGTLVVAVTGAAQGPICWASSPATGYPACTEVQLPQATGWLPRSTGSWRLDQARSRLYLRVADPACLPPPPVAGFRALCTRYRCRGLVYFGDDGPMVRSREFSVSDGAELVATGGAATGIAAVLRSRGRTGLVEVIQGPPTGTLGYLLVRCTEPAPLVGGRVLPLHDGSPVAPGKPCLERDAR